MKCKEDCKEDNFIVTDYILVRDPEGSLGDPFRISNISQFSTRPTGEKYQILKLTAHADNFHSANIAIFIANKAVISMVRSCI